MGWFGGVVTTTSCPIIRPVSPTWSRELPHGELWTLGTKTRIAVTTTDVGLLQGAVLGSHTVTADHLQRWLSEDWRHGPPPGRVPMQSSYSIRKGPLCSPIPHMPSLSISVRWKELWCGPPPAVPCRASPAVG